jgi:hypothetical protein
MADDYTISEKIKAFWGYRCLRTILPAINFLDNFLPPTTEERQMDYSKITYKDCLKAVHQARLKIESERASRPSLVKDLSQFIRDVSGR